MRINTFIVILLVTFIICNNNNHIKGQENNGIRNLADTCAAAFGALDGTYQTLTPPSTETGTTQFIKRDKLVKVTAANVYTFFSSVEKSTTAKTKIFTIQAESTFKLDTTTTFSGNKNYKFPWAGTRPDAKDTTPIGSIESGYSADCDSPGMKSDNQLKEADNPKLLSYEKIDQYSETLDEIRNVIDDTAIGESIMLSRVDTAAPLRNYNIFLSKTQFCHFSCKIDNTECNLLVYETANYKSEVINTASIIGVTDKAKYYKTVKADAVAAVDTCVTDSATTDECTKPLYTVISKGTGKILTGYYKDEKTKYLVSASPPKIPAAIYAKFPTYIYCIGEPGVQGVSNMFINSILLILIVILMI